MTRAEIAEFERLWTAYRAAVSRNTTGYNRLEVARTRRSLETALVLHAEDLIAAVKASQPSVTDLTAGGKIAPSENQQEAPS